MLDHRDISWPSNWTARDRMVVTLEEAPKGLSLEELACLSRTAVVTASHVLTQLRKSGEVIEIGAFKARPGRGRKRKLWALA